jgi:hypothetical protein
VYRAVFRPDLAPKPGRNAGFAWRYFLIAGLQGSLIPLLACAGIIAFFVAELFATNFFGANAVPSYRLSFQSDLSALLYILLFALPLALWCGGAYSHFTRFQSGRLARAQRVLISALAAFPAPFFGNKPYCH